MADDLIQQCNSLCLDEDDKDLFDLGVVKSGEETGKLELQIIGKLVTNRTYNEEAFRKTMAKVWRPANNMIIHSIGPNLYMFQFFHWKDKQKVMGGRPWCWENNLLLLKEVDGEEQPENVTLNLSPFWIRVCNLPFNCRTMEDVIASTANLGNLLEVEEDSLRLGSYSRVRAEIDIRKPLRRHQWIKDKKGNRIKINFKYERLPFFCFACGIIGHAEKDCTVSPEEERGNDLGWGTFLRASPRKGHSKEHREALAIASTRKQLFTTRNTENSRMVTEENQGILDTQQVNGGMLISVGGDIDGKENYKEELVAGQEEGMNRTKVQGESQNSFQLLWKTGNYRTAR